MAGETVLAVMCLFFLVVGKSIDRIWIASKDVGDIQLKDDLRATIAVATDLAPYGISMFGRTFLTFDLKSCRDAFVTLVGPNENFAFQIVFGANENTLISLFSLNNVFYSNFPNGLLDCKEFQTFWFSWNNLNFRIGRGSETFENEIFSHQETLSGIEFSGFDKIMIYSGYGANGTWIIHNHANPDGHFRKAVGLRASVQNLQTFISRSNIQCSALCDRNDNCAGYNYNSNNDECELLKGDQLITTIANNEWTYGMKCLQGSTACIIF